jgi:hypothetical protein
MCALLNDNLLETTDIAGKKQQYNRWHRYFDYTRKGDKFIIGEIFETVIPANTALINRNEYGGVERWNELFEYVEHVLLGFEQNQRMPKKYVLRLEGLSKGVFSANNKVKPMAMYQYHDLFLACKIAYVLMRSKTDYKSLDHKFAYAMTIVESKVNDVVMAKRKNQRAEDKLDLIDYGNFTNERAEYTPTSKINKSSKILESLW